METEEKLKKRIAYEKMLAGISERAVSVDDLDEFLDESLRRMGGILDVSRIFIFTYHPVSDHFRPSGGSHFLRGMPTEIANFSVGGCMTWN